MRRNEKLYDFEFLIKVHVISRKGTFNKLNRSETSIEIINQNVLCNKLRHSQVQGWGAKRKKWEDGRREGGRRTKEIFN